MARLRGTEGYAQEAPNLLKTYESITFEQSQGRLLPLLPAPPARLLDIGAGTGRDAAGFAALGYDVVAAEPTDEMREGARRLHADAAIEWLDLRQRLGTEQIGDVVNGRKGPARDRRGRSSLLFVFP